MNSGIAVATAGATAGERFARALASLFAASHGLITDPAAEPGVDLTQGPAGNRSTRPASR